MRNANAGVGWAEVRAGILQRLPRGLLWGCLIVVLLHALLIQCVGGESMTGRRIREKILALTHHSRAVLVVAGDSRACSGLDPRILAGRLNLPQEATANIAVAGAATPALCNAYFDLSSRFPDRPIMLMNVSVFTINDRAQQLAQDEVLWSVGWADRFKLAPVDRVFRVSFLPEKTLLNRFIHLDEPEFTFEPQRGFRPGVADEVLTDAPVILQERVAALCRAWLNGPDTQGIRWQVFARDVARLRQAGVQLVLFDFPLHPAIETAVQGTPDGVGLERFRMQISRYCRENDLPLLCYGLEDLPAGRADRLFRDLVHLNGEGACWLSGQIAADLAALIQAGRVRRP